MTPLRDAILIVPTQDIWVAVPEDDWNECLAVLDWNSALMRSGCTLPISSVKIGLLEEVFRVGKMCRPIGAYKDFQNQPIVVKKCKRKVK